MTGLDQPRMVCWAYNNFRTEFTVGDSVCVMIKYKMAVYQFVHKADEDENEGNINQVTNWGSLGILLS